MAELLGNLYKLMDDIYESVRRAAYGTTKMYLQVRFNYFLILQNMGTLISVVMNGLNWTS